MLSEEPVSPSAGHGCCLASLSEIRSEGVQHLRAGRAEGAVPEGLWEGVPGEPAEAAAGAAGSAGGDPGAAPAAGPRQRLRLGSGEQVG